MIHPVDLNVVYYCYMVSELSSKLKVYQKYSDELMTLLTLPSVL